MKEISWEAPEDDVSIKLCYDGVLGCCGMVQIYGFSVKGFLDEWGDSDYEAIEEWVYNNQELVHEAYDYFMKEIARRCPTKLLLAADTPDYNSYAAGTADSNSFEGASLREFCKYHGFEVSAEIPRSAHKKVNLYTLACTTIIENKRHYLHYKGKGPLCQSEWKEY